MWRGHSQQNAGNLLLSSVAKHKCCLVGSSLLIFLSSISAPLSLSSNTCCTRLDHTKPTFPYPEPPTSVYPDFSRQQPPDEPVFV